MINVELKGLKQKRERYKKASEFVKGMVLGYANIDAYSTILLFQKNLLINGFHLKELKPSTIARKRKNKYRWPEMPLVGIGKKKGINTLYSSLRLEKLDNGTRVYVSKDQHHGADRSLEYLFGVHEKGCTIQRGETTIKIPPRPAFKRAIQMGRKEAKGLRKSRLKEMRKAIQIYAETGDMNLIRVIANFRKLGKKFE